MAARVALAPCVQAWAMRPSENAIASKAVEQAGSTQKRNKKSRFDDPPINHRDQTCPALAVFVNVNAGRQVTRACAPPACTHAVSQSYGIFPQTVDFER